MTARSSVLSVDGPPRVPADERSARPPLALLPTGWPLVALIAFFPLWWALGLGEFIGPLLAVPMITSLRRRGRIRVPPFFWLWLLLLTWMLVSSLTLGVQVPGTVHSSFAHHVPAFAFHLAQYGAATVTLLYVGNLTEAEFSRRRLVRLLGIFFLYVLAGGLAGLLWPRANFTTPVESLLVRVFAHGNWNASFITDLAHPHTADVQDVLGYTSPRPSAPFPYTNTWGFVISILMIWFVVWLWPGRGAGARLAVVLAACLFTVAVVASLNRGVWIGMVGVVVYLGLRRLAPRRAIAVIAIGLAAIAVFFVTALGNTVRLRLDHPHSNAGRAEQSIAAVRGALGSPVVGYGSTRTLVGNTRSIAEAPTPACPLCGGIAIGSAGEFWLILFAQGFAGAALLVGFLLSSLWAYRHDRSPIGLAGRLTIMLALLYMLFYDAGGAPLSLTFIGIALLWRNEQAH